MPTVSVLMPSYNHAEFLSQTIQSLMGQSMDDWELIAIDDGSMDESAEILAGIDDPRVRTYQNEQNLGTYGTLARALSFAKSDLVAILDSDDIWMPTKLALQAALLAKHSEADACYTAGYKFGDSGPSADTMTGWPEVSLQEPLPHLLEQNRVLASSVVFRRSKLTFEPSLRYSGDRQALLKAAQRSPLAFVAEPVTGWRIHARNTFVRSRGQVAEEIRMRQSILAVPTFWQVRSVPEMAIRQGLSKCAIHLSALLVLEGRMKEARVAARLALKLNRSLQSLKRFAAVTLSHRSAKRKLWPESAGLEPSVPAELITFDDRVR